jgi:hypothetical protein
MRRRAVGGGFRRHSFLPSGNLEEQNWDKVVSLFAGSYRNFKITLIKEDPIPILLNGWTSIFPISNPWLNEITQSSFCDEYKEN